MKKTALLQHLANFISLLAHPLLILTYTIIFFFNSDHYLGAINPDIKKTIYSIFLILTFVLPALFIPILYFFGIIANFSFKNRKEKLFPLLTVAIMYSLAWYFMNRVFMPPILLNIVLSSLITIIAIGIITIFWDISAHATGTGALLGFLFYMSIIMKLQVLFAILIAILLAGLIGSARLYLKKHNQLQIYLGYLLGFISVFVSLLIL